MLEKFGKLQIILEEVFLKDRYHCVWYISCPKTQKEISATSAMVLTGEPGNILDFEFWTSQDGYHEHGEILVERQDQKTCLVCLHDPLALFDGAIGLFRSS